MSLDLNECLKLLVEHNASDLHLKVGSAPIVRKNKELLLLYKDGIPLTQEDIEVAIDSFLTESVKKKLKKEKQIDLSIGISKLGRFRLNIFYQRSTLRLVARKIPFKIPTYKDLNLPDSFQNILKNINKTGLILITGSTGNGKSSTIVSMLNDINNRYSKHIITIEDPIEFLIKDKKSLITQRELGIDYLDYNSALTSTLRQDPDIIFFGELRNTESMEITLNASNTGHLVFSTLHTNNVVDTINRVMGMVNPERKKLYRMEFASSLKAIVCQKLVMRKDHTGLIPVLEILINNPRVRKILEDETKSISQLQEIIEESHVAWGMQSFNQHLLELVKKDIISKKIALETSPQPEKLNLIFNGLDHSNSESQKLKVNYEEDENFQSKKFKRKKFKLKI
ncbi:MAG: PilT/PilU family type 4a pilus ATPase [Bdellovibrionales bacterium]|nr:PilT/PilU family type 4a pilus ATPase [Bdellovibrionales bacterium]